MTCCLGKGRGGKKRSAYLADKKLQVVLAAKERTGNPIKSGPFGICSRCIFCSYLNSAMEEKNRWAQLSTLLCCLAGRRAMRALQQQWAQHSCQEKRRLVLQTWYCQTMKQKYAALFWERLLLHRFVSCPESISEGTYVAENLVYSDQSLGLKVQLTCA